MYVKVIVVQFVLPAVAVHSDTSSLFSMDEEPRGELSAADFLLYRGVAVGEIAFAPRGCFARGDMILRPRPSGVERTMILEEDSN